MAMISRSGTRSRRNLIADINVTPLVDVMLVLLIVFMVTAPLLVTGVTVDLPKTRTSQLPASQKAPLTVTVGARGELFLGEQKTSIPPEQLAARLTAIASGGYDERIYVRGDRMAAYGHVMNALSLLQVAGFVNVALITDPQGVPREAK